MNEYHITTGPDGYDIVYGHHVRINENGDLMVFERLDAGQHELVCAFAKGHWQEINRFKEGED